MAIGNRIVQERPVIYRPNMTVISNKENVTYYARVSTQNEEQEDSYERQKEHFESKIRANPNWNYVEGYKDWGISGTKAESRKDFMRMIEDCRAGKIDKILVKSISRFGRNTVDTLKYIRELRELGISVYFETQNIDTMTGGGDVLITILAAMAEQESRTMSTNIKWAFQKRFKDGKVIINYRQSLGYDKVVHVNENGEKESEYVVVESEAEIIRKIYRDYLSGKTVRQIAEELNAEGIKTKKGNEWQANKILGILTNEKYTGNAILGKTYKPDVLSKSRLKNEGQAPSYYVENSHPAIITQEMFDMVQEEKRRRSELRSTVKTGRGRYSSKYALSGLLICGDCGGKFRRFGRRLKSGEYIPTWVCVTHQNNHTACAMKPLKEADICSAYKRAIDGMIGSYSDIVATVKRSIEEEMKNKQTTDSSNVEEELLMIRKDVIELFKKKRSGEITSNEYESEYARYSEKIIELEKTLEDTKSIEVQNQLLKTRLEKAFEILDSKEIDYMEDNVMRALLDCIKVEGKHSLEFQFKCGINIRENI